MLQLESEEEDGEEAENTGSDLEEDETQVQKFVTNFCTEYTYSNVGRLTQASRISNTLVPCKMFQTSLLLQQSCLCFRRKVRVTELKMRSL